MQGIKYVGDGHKCIIENLADGAAIGALVVGIYLNGTSGTKKFVETMLDEPVNTQINFTVLCHKWFLAVAKLRYWDDRNKASVELGKAITALSLDLERKPAQKGKSDENVTIEYRNTLEVVKVTAFYLNVSSDNYEDFIKQALNDHQTLQQCFSRLCIAWLKALTTGNPNSRAKHITAAKAMLSCEICLPYI